MYTEIRCEAIIAPARRRQERECEPMRIVAKQEEMPNSGSCNAARCFASCDAGSYLRRQRLRS